jgi:hypothetical protein
VSRLEYCPHAAQATLRGEVGGNGVDGLGREGSLSPETRDELRTFDATVATKSLKFLRLDVFGPSATNALIEAITTLLPNHISRISPPMREKTGPPDVACPLMLENGCRKLAELCISLHLA